MRTNRIHETIAGTGPVTTGGWVGCSSAKTSWMGLQVLTGVRERSTRTTWAVQLPRIDRKRTRYNLSGGSRLSGGGETFAPVVKGIGDEELVSRVAEGDDHALSELYDRYGIGRAHV